MFLLAIEPELSGGGIKVELVRFVNVTASDKELLGFTGPLEAPAALCTTQGHTCGRTDWGFFIWVSASFLLASISIAARQPIPSAMAFS